MLYMIVLVINIIGSFYKPNEYKILNRICAVIMIIVLLIN